MKKWIIVAITAVLLAGVGGIAIAVSGSSSDNGVEACQAMVDRSENNSENPELTREEYQQLRDVFESSSHSDVREAGVEFADVMWEINDIPEENSIELLGYYNLIMEKYSALREACGNHDVELPKI